VVAIGADGTLCTPPTERGAVAGIALEVASERLPALRRRDLSRRDLLAARGVAVINAVRGARALVALDGAALGAESTALAERLSAVLDDE
jgi:branched-subunit amino acid aminotransferase/4-amino-4-deoxychorismate lyase